MFYFLPISQASVNPPQSFPVICQVWVAFFFFFSFPVLLVVFASLDHEFRPLWMKIFAKWSLFFTKENT